jgi:hypothetical protein
VREEFTMRTRKRSHVDEWAALVGERVPEDLARESCCSPSEENWQDDT